MAGGIHFYDMHEMLKENARKRRTRESHHATAKPTTTCSYPETGEDDRYCMQ